MKHKYSRKQWDQRATSALPQASVPAGKEGPAALSLQPSTPPPAFVRQSLGDKAGEWLEIEFVAVTRNEKVNGAGIFFEPKGLDLTRFVKNPVLLYQHASYIVPIGEVVELAITEDYVAARAMVSPLWMDQLGDAWTQIERGILKAISIAFHIKEGEPVEDDDGKRIGLRAIKSLLNEISVVTLGADEDALISAVRRVTRDAAGDVVPETGDAETREVETKMPQPAPEWATETDADGGLRMALTNAEERLAAMPAPTVQAYAEPDNPDGLQFVRQGIESALPPMATPTPNAPKQPLPEPPTAQATLPPQGQGQEPTEPPTEWLATAHSDGAALALFARGDDVKGVHHADDGDMAPDATRRCMGVLLGARGGYQSVLDAERAKGHAHLAAHYAEADMEVPEWRAYTQDELSELAAKGEIIVPGQPVVTIQTEEPPEAPPEPVEPPAALSSQVKQGLSSLAAAGPPKPPPPLTDAELDSLALAAQAHRMRMQRRIMVAVAQMSQRVSEMARDARARMREVFAEVHEAGKSDRKDTD